LGVGLWSSPILLLWFVLPATLSPLSLRWEGWSDLGRRSGHTLAFKIKIQPRSSLCSHLMKEKRERMEKLVFFWPGVALRGSLLINQNHTLKHPMIERTNTTDNSRVNVILAIGDVGSGEGSVKWNKVHTREIPPD
jgi:hypothetical protein